MHGQFVRHPVLADSKQGRDINRARLHLPVPSRGSQGGAAATEDAAEHAERQDHRHCRRQLHGLRYTPRTEEADSCGIPHRQGLSPQ